jgi:hypothetical protein
MVATLTPIYRGEETLLTQGSAGYRGSSARARWGQNNGSIANLQNIFVEELEPFEKNIGQFVVARQLSGHPVAISNWDKESA